MPERQSPSMEIQKHNLHHGCKQFFFFICLFQYFSYDFITMNREQRQPSLLELDYLSN